ncbi:hypothetical protein F6U93_01075 [Tamlana haliotis]|uniref:Uncharacterized protein n=1 Tax=Pseudotamlana haliotis TaxID=2614804 RepID=A0A6N6MN84_9FLAO|nr:hypothetical protein [Tamlana haliotis]KAB1071348.1 hypothetical protein F6U93_01075 [Tamlana haliotis]
MRFYKIFVLITLLILNSCDTDDGMTDPVLNLLITDLVPSNNEVKIDWSLEKSNNVIIQDLLIIREVIDQDGRFTSNTIANIPTNINTYIDRNIPYQSSISYKVKAIYFIDKDLKEGEFYDILDVESQIETYNREIVAFEAVPFQVVKDPVEDHIFHWIDRMQTAKLKKYDALQNKIIDSIDLSENIYHNVVFKIKDNTIYISDDNGNFKLIDKNSYDLNNQFSVAINEKLKSFSIDGNRIYYHDDNVLKFYDLIKNESVNQGWAYLHSSYMETIKPNTILFGGFSVTEITTESCIDINNCIPNNLYIYNYESGEKFYFDPFIFSWNNEKTKFISSYYGNVMNINDLSNDFNLKEITGKNYFQASFDENNNIYATVQGEKLIHVFNSSYELIDSIETTLFPLFPIISQSGLQCISSYDPVLYYGYRYGFEFNFGNKKCAIEIL